MIVKAFFLYIKVVLFLCKEKKPATLMDFIFIL